MNINADTYQNNSFFRLFSVQIINRDIELSFFQMESVRDSRLIALDNLCPGRTFCGQLADKESASISGQIC